MLVLLSRPPSAGKYIIDKELMKILQPHAVVMHPLPRVDEVSTRGGGGGGGHTLIGLLLHCYYSAPSWLAERLLPFRSSVNL